jgi:hypothetical protein
MRDLVLTITDIKPVDIEYLHRLSQLTNIVPLIARSDMISTTDLELLEEKLTSTLHEANIQPFNFIALPQESPLQAYSPYAISTATSKDHENMDASLLMSPDYISPLVQSELATLVSHIFEPSSISWLRHSAAKKYVQWRNSSQSLQRPQSLYSPLRPSSFTSSQVLTAPVGATTSYALAHITDHTQREEKIAQVRLANWAADLQRSLQNERARFEDLARSERAVWLTERLGECVQDGALVPVSEARKRDGEYTIALVKPDSSYTKKSQRGREGMDRHDPLGLLQLNVELRRRGWLTVRLLSGVGIIGGLAFWIVRTWQGGEGEGTIWGIGGRDWAELRAALR